VSLPTITVVALSALNGGEKTVKLICVGCLATRFKLLANLGSHKYRLFIQIMCVCCATLLLIGVQEDNPRIILVIASV